MYGVIWRSTKAFFFFALEFLQVGVAECQCTLAVCHSVWVYKVTRWPDSGCVVELCNFEIVGSLRLNFSCYMLRKFWRPNSAFGRDFAGCILNPLSCADS